MSLRVERALARVDILCPVGDRVEAGSALLVLRRSGEFPDGVVRYSVLSPRLSCAVTEFEIELLGEELCGELSDVSPHDVSPRDVSPHDASL